MQKLQIDEDRALEILGDWDKIKKGIHVLIEYEDVLGNPQTTVDLRLN